MKMLINAGSPLSLREAVVAAKNQPKLWGEIPRIIPVRDSERLMLVTDSATKSRMKVEGFDIVDEYEEQYLRALPIQTLTIDNGWYSQHT
jgi:hypothetical protein